MAPLTRVPLLSFLLAIAALPRITNGAKTTSIQPKMLGDDVYPGKAFNAAIEEDKAARSIRTRYAIFVGKCSKNRPFEFTIGGRSGRGAIGTPTVSSLSDDIQTCITSVDLVFPNQEGTGEISIAGKPEPNFFSFGQTSEDFAAAAAAVGTSSLVGTPFAYKNFKSHQGSAALVHCFQEEEIDVVVAVKDDAAEVVEAAVTSELNGEGQRVELLGGRHSETTLVAESVHQGTRRMTSTTTEEETTNSITLRKLSLAHSQQEKHQPDDGEAQHEEQALSFIQLMIKSDEEGFIVPKTIIVHDLDSPPAISQIQAIQVNNAHIDENSDVVLAFQSFGDDGDFVKLDARIGISNECSNEELNVVDMTAMVPKNEPYLVVNGGWFRRTTKANGIDSNCEWEVVVVEAVASDPDNSYTRIGLLMDTAEKVGVMNGHMDDGGNGRLLLKEANRRRQLLKAPPTPEELEINQEMKFGRRPKPSTSLRGLSAEKHMRILVHGYCDRSSPFPLSHFDSATIEFSDPDNYADGSNFSNNQFALKIHYFAVNNGITGCGIIAHSQGGMASLHLLNYYWSCLDDADRGGSRRIQSVGTPYQGTLLAGNLAYLGDIFGQGCGKNNDLTENGATNWLRFIGSVARREVHYYTTSFTDKWWRYDYCHAATELFLSDPEDGATERGRGQLPGGNNRGHKTGQCHVRGMRDRSQTLDFSRNKDMQANTKY